MLIHGTGTGDPLTASVDQSGSKMVNNPCGRTQRTASAMTAAGSATCISTRSIQHPANAWSVKGSCSPVARASGASTRCAAASSMSELGSTPTALTPRSSRTLRSCPAPHPTSSTGAVGLAKEWVTAM